MWAESPTNLWANQPTAMRDSLFKEKLEWGAGAAGGGGKAAIATVPPKEALYTRMETAVCICPSSGGEGLSTLPDFVQKSRRE